MARRKLVDLVKKEHYNTSTSTQKGHRKIFEKQREALKEIVLSDIEL